MDARSKQWFLPSADELLWEQWEQDYTIFDRKTRETHLINELPAEILRILSEHPAATEEVATHLAERCEVENDTEWSQKITHIIANLASLGLIEKLQQ